MYLSRVKSARRCTTRKGVRWVRTEQLHLTLSFLGDVEAAGEETLRDALAACM